MTVDYFITSSRDDTSVDFLARRKMNAIDFSDDFFSDFDFL